MAYLLRGDLLCSFKPQHKSSLINKGRLSLSPLEETASIDCQCVKDPLVLWWLASGTVICRLLCMIFICVWNTVFQILKYLNPCICFDIRGMLFYLHAFWAVGHIALKLPRVALWWLFLAALEPSSDITGVIVSAVQLALLSVGSKFI